MLFRSNGPKRLPDDVAAAERAIHLRLAPRHVGVGAFLNGGDRLLKFRERAGVQRSRHGDGSTVPDKNAVLRLRGLVAHQHAVAGGQRDAVDRRARRREVGVALGGDTAAVLPRQALHQRINVGLTRCVARIDRRRQVQNLGDRAEIEIGEDGACHVRSAAQSRR